MPYRSLCLVAEFGGMCTIHGGGELLLDCLCRLDIQLSVGLARVHVMVLREYPNIIARCYLLPLNTMVVRIGP